MRVVIADGHEVVRVGMRSLLAGEPGLEVVGEAATGHETLALCRQLQPDLALIAVLLPGLDGLATTRLLRQECPKTRVIVVTARHSPEYLLEALKAGAADYILEDASLPELINAIRRVLQGETILNEEVVAALLRRLAGAQPHTADLSISRLGPQDLEVLQLLATVRLTPRELEVLQLLAAGYTHQAIASQLHVSIGTVGLDVAHILGKLQWTDDTQTAIHSMQLGLRETDAE